VQVNPDRWRRIEALVHEALDRAPDAREAFLDQACADDAQVHGAGAAAGAAGG